MNKRNIILSAAERPSYVAVSYLFVDRYMPEANGEFVKVYLYLLRLLSGENVEVSIAYLADCLNNTEGDIERALRYWEKAGLLSLEETAGSISGIHVLDAGEATWAAAPKQEPKKAPKPDRRETKTMPLPLDSNPEVSPQEKENTPQRTVLSGRSLQKVLKSDEFQPVIKLSEQYLGHELSPMELQLFLYLHQDLQFSSELILYLLEYAVSEQKTSPSYLEAVALNWHREHVQTIQEAEKITAKYLARNKVVKKAFGLSRMPGEAEQAFIDQWFLTYGFSQELVQEACKRSLLATGKPDFKYAQKILSNWHEEKVTTLEQVASADEDFRRKSKSSASPGGKTTTGSFGKFQQRTYSSEDLKRLQQQLLKRDMGC